MWRSPDKVMYTAFGKILAIGWISKYKPKVFPIWRVNRDIIARGVDMGRKEWANIVLCLIIFGANRLWNPLYCRSHLMSLISFNPEAVASTSAVKPRKKRFAWTAPNLRLTELRKGVKARFEITNGSHGTVKDNRYFL